MSAGRVEIAGSDEGSPVKGAVDGEPLGPLATLIPQRGKSQFHFSSVVRDLGDGVARVAVDTHHLEALFAQVCLQPVEACQMVLANRTGAIDECHHRGLGTPHFCRQVPRFAGHRLGQHQFGQVRAQRSLGIRGKGE